METRLRVDTIKILTQVPVLECYWGFFLQQKIPPAGFFVFNYES